MPARDRGRKPAPERHNCLQITVKTAAAACGKTPPLRV